MKTVLFAGMATALIGLAGAAAAQDVIAQRREGMRTEGRQMEAIKGVLDARGDTRPLVERVDTIAAFYRDLQALYPPGTQTGETRALPAIWSDPAGFEAARTTIVAALGTLRVAAASGDLPATTAGFTQVGAACAACHRAYRGPAR
ncbi:cytochrome c [Roseomonas terrae]|uniref:Cytochrome c n=1 Tax=Neoroseomonas terrae TaxID=424799 RepID=A0ABS5EHM7_9PROT|nr:cytochrome c [Neoroseomonas terrae]MBR0650507.1 cytochrome c [Neoroseomonas terrae]